MTIPSLPSFATARRTLTIGSLSLAWLALMGCTRAPQISTQAAGHAITARIKGDATKVESRSDGARLSSEFGEVTVERTRMRIDDASWLNIAEGAPVTVSIERGRISVQAGAVSVSRTVSN
jgi:hypothetical protein